VQGSAAPEVVRQPGDAPADAAAEERAAPGAGQTRPDSSVEVQQGRQGSAAAEVVRQPGDAPADAAAEERAAPGAGQARPDSSAEVQQGRDDGRPSHPTMCLTQKRVGEAALQRVTVETAQADSAAQVPVSCGVEEVIDAKTACCRGTRQAQDNERETVEAGSVLSGDVEAGTASGPVLTTVAQVQAALLQARQVGRHDIVVWARCARCGRVGRVVHFDGELRASAREPG
jgi:hypothetical protein